MNEPKKKGSAGMTEKRASGGLRREAYFCLDFFVTFCIKTKSNGPLRPRGDEGCLSTLNELKTHQLNCSNKISHYR
jgi:hypothetical protein